MADLNQRRKFIINASYWAIVVAIVFLVTRYLLGLVWPFFLAFLFAWLMTPVIRWMTVKCHIKRTFAVAMCLLLFFAVAAALLVVVLISASSWVQRLIVWLPTLYTDIIDPVLRSGTQQLLELAERLGPEATATVQSVMPNLISTVADAVSGFSLRAVTVVSGWLTKLPSFLLTSLICIIATVFMTVDFHRITAFLFRQLPERPRHVVRKAKDAFVVVVTKYGKSYGIIMGITFLELLAGLIILRQEQPGLVAAAIAIFDIFPIVGAGLIIIPWSAVTLLSGNIAKGLGLFAMWVILTIVRQIIEPRVVGHQVGLHPLVTLIAMLVGTKLFGGIGLFGLPIACAIIKSLDDTGVIHVLHKEQDAPVMAARTGTVGGMREKK